MKGKNKKTKLLIVNPHMSTGGLPQYLLDYIKSFKSEYSEIKVIEFTNFSSSYVIQKNKIKKLIGHENVICLGEYDETNWESDKLRLIPILDEYKPDTIWMNEFPEAYEYIKPPKSVMDYIYRTDRPYKIFETTHSNSFDFKNKRYIGDEFMFCSNLHLEQSKDIDIPKKVWEVPINIKERPDRDSTLQSLGLDPSYYHVLNVGLFQDNKNQKYIFGLANKMKSDKVMFHFIGNECFLDRCDITEVEFKLDNYKIWGERSDVDVFMSCMDVFLFPSKKELNPLTIRESLSWNMEVIVNRDEYVNQYLDLPNFQIIDEINVESFIKNKLKKFLLVCSFYNKEFDQIKRTIDNIINQSYTNWELIVGDDFSDNDCKSNLIDYMKEVNDDRISFYDIKEKYELYLYQNFFKEIEYDYYFDLDSDDILNRDILNIYQKHFIKYEEVSSIFCDYIVVDENNNRERYGLVKPSDDLLEDFNIRLDSTYMSIWEKRSSWSMFGVARSFRRSEFDTFEIGKKCRTATDSMLLFNTLIEGNHLHIPMNLYTYERRKNSDSFTPMSEQELKNYNVNTLLAIDKYDSSYNSYGIYSDIYQETSAIIMSGYKDDIGLITDITDDQHEKLTFLYGDKVKLNDYRCENLIILKDYNSIDLINKNISLYKYFDDLKIDENDLKNYFHDEMNRFLSNVPKIGYNYFHYFRHLIVQKEKTKIMISHSDMIIDKNNDNTNRFIIDDISGIKFEVNGNKKETYVIDFIDQDSGEVIHTDKIDNNMWTSPSPKYFINWEIKKNGVSIYKQNLKGKRVLIVFGSSSLGDTIAWFPYLREFKLKHECEIVISTFKNWMFEGSDEYNDFEFLEPGHKYSNINKVYDIGWYTNNGEIDWSMHPSNFRENPLQKTASDILGLEHKQIRPIINMEYSDKSPLNKKYVCIAIHSTAQSKYWNNPDGWQDIVDYIKGCGLEVVLISNENGGYMGNIHPTGIIEIESGGLDIPANYLKHSELFVGIGSGLAWLSWVVGTPTVLISGFSEEYTEFSGENVHRIINKDVCNGCFNSHKFDPSDWNWCPLHKGTDRQFECSKSITSKEVIKSVNHFINIDFNWGTPNSGWDKSSFEDEIFVDKCYEKVLKVEKGDIVLDIGASIGPFTNTILHKDPKEVYCFEPSKSEIDILRENTKNFATIINKGIGDINGTIILDETESKTLLGWENSTELITFRSFLDEYQIDKIDFLKTDCEGGEYSIFTEENMEWIKSNVSKITGEWHLRGELNDKFKHFRDNILVQFDEYQIYSVDGVDIKWDLFNDHFTEYYNEVLIHIDNRNK